MTTSTATTASMGKGQGQEQEAKYSQQADSTTTTTTANSNVGPSTMRAVQVLEYGDIDEQVWVRDNVPIPSLQQQAMKNEWKDVQQKMIIRVLAVALAPGDVRVLSGRTRELQGPPRFPYVPGGDVCGMVHSFSPHLSSHDEELQALSFTVGDVVAVRFLEGPRGALGSYAVVSTKTAVKIEPELLARLQATGIAALAGASPATALVERLWKQSQASQAPSSQQQQQQQGSEHAPISNNNDDESSSKKPTKRVLILGAGGGMGSHVCQLLRCDEHTNYFIVGESSTPARLTQPPLCYNETIDYTQQDVFARPEYLENPFDIVIDLASTGAWLRLVASTKENGAGRSIVKSASAGGWFLTTGVDTPEYDVHGIWDALKLFLFPALWRALYTRLAAPMSNLPKYTWATCLDDNNSAISKTMQLAAAGKLQPVVDERGPFDMSTPTLTTASDASSSCSEATAAVRKAFALQRSRHAHGKVVIRVAPDSTATLGQDEFHQ